MQIIRHNGIDYVAGLEFSANDFPEITFTEQEVNCIKSVFESWTEQGAIHPASVEFIKHAIVADGLSEAAHNITNGSNAQLSLAAEGLGKAYKVHQLPPFLFQKAQILERMENLEEARKVYRAFLDDIPRYNAVVAEDDCKGFRDIFLEKAWSAIDWDASPPIWNMTTAVEKAKTITKT